MMLLPKVHLHVHLESTIRRTTMAEIAVTNGAPVPARVHERQHLYVDFTEFLFQNSLIRNCLCRAKDFRRIAYEYCEDEASQGTRYAEVYFTAATHGNRVGDLAMPLLAVLEGLEEGQAAFGITVRLLLDHSRRRSVELAAQTVDLAARHQTKGVIGVGLAGDDRLPLAPFAHVFRKAVDGGLRIVHHAGEASGGGAESVREAIGPGGADRIAHGICALDDASLVEELVDRHIGLDVCPSSNVALGFASSLTTHPLPRLLAAGLIVSINTDIPSLLGISLLDEYDRVRKTFGYGSDEIARLASHAIIASFAPPEMKRTLHRDLAAWSANYP